MEPMKKNNVKTGGDEILEFLSFVVPIFGMLFGSIALIFAMTLSYSNYNILNEPYSVTIARQRSESVRQAVIRGEIKPQPKRKKSHWVYVELQTLEEANVRLADPDYEWEMYNIARGGPYTLRRLEK